MSLLSRLVGYSFPDTRQQEYDAFFKSKVYDDAIESDVCRGCGQAVPSETAGAVLLKDQKRVMPIYWITYKPTHVDMTPEMNAYGRFYACNPEIADITFILDKYATSSTDDGSADGDEPNGPAPEVVERNKELHLARTIEPRVFPNGDYNRFDDPMPMLSYIVSGFGPWFEKALNGHIRDREDGRVGTMREIRIKAMTPLEFRVFMWWAHTHTFPSGVPDKLVWSLYGHASRTLKLPAFGRACEELLKLGITMDTIYSRFRELKDARKRGEEYPVLREHCYNFTRDHFQEMYTTEEFHVSIENTMFIELLKSNAIATKTRFDAGCCRLVALQPYHLQADSNMYTGAKRTRQYDTHLAMTRHCSDIVGAMPWAEMEHDDIESALYHTRNEFEETMGKLAVFWQTAAKYMRTQPKESTENTENVAKKDENIDESPENSDDAVAPAPPLTAEEEPEKEKEKETEKE